MAIGGAILGALTAAVTQAIGVPVAVPDGSGEEIDNVRRRLGSAVGIPLTALILLVILVLPFAWASSSRRSSAPVAQPSSAFSPLAESSDSPPSPAPSRTSSCLSAR